LSLILFYLIDGSVQRIVGLMRNVIGCVTDR